MSLKMRYYYIVGIWSFCFVLPIMMGCMREEKKSSKDSFEMLYQQMEQASVESPEQVSQMVDSALPSLKDSMMYYRLLFLKVRTRVRDKDCVKNRVKRAKIVRFTLC